MYAWISLTKIILHNINSSKLNIHKFYTRDKTNNIGSTVNSPINVLHLLVLLKFQRNKDIKVKFG